MKILLYLEAEHFLRKSGIGRAIHHQMRALDIAGIPYTRDPKDDYDLVHINTYGLKSVLMFWRAKRAGKKIVFHGHSTEEDFRNSFVFSNALAPLIRKFLTYFYSHSDLVITPTEYSKRLIASYGVTTPIVAISNGIDLAKYVPDPKKEAAFVQRFHVEPDQKVVMAAGLYFKRKGIDEFVQVAKAMPDVRFIWFGETNLWVVPRWIRRLVKKDHPSNVEFPGYIKGDVYEGAMSASDAFFFPSREETEGIVTLEALASHQHVIVRDIGVYDGWLDDTAATLAQDVPGFVRALEDAISGRVDKREKGYQVAQSRGIDKIAEQLIDAYYLAMEGVGDKA